MPSKIEAGVSRWMILVPGAIFVALWQGIATAFPSTLFFFSSPEHIGAALWDVTKSGDIVIHAAITLFEALAGLVIGMLVGTSVGLALWYWPKAGWIGGPYIAAISTVPPFALAPLVIVWFGIGIFAKVMVAALATVFVGVVQTYAGARSVDERHLRLVRLLGASRRQEFSKVVVPSTAHWLLNSLRLNVGFALTGAFIGEFISAERGLGYFIVRSAALYDMSRVLAGCLVLMIVGVGLNAIVNALERKLVHRRRPV
ncbi:MAG TPA: ABC transporter permease [Polyangiaceae bacterium]